ncbi:glycosyltransferase [Prochlorococcus marinus]|uniref:glycosyltransferase n=1 Tax=Prochlorococcus marinus TaxID=1219 RepID=UPI001ADB7DD2|nr:glycosyltransferase [Prochlorococcus marinus]MBO8221386.1 hypothetical protein [Prochlorococcus marinus CUG1417]MBW3074196.1 hypothetical protein [Prochlorococcus marinus str. MU1417]
MYFLQNFFIFLRKLSIRILLREYPNKLLKASSISSFKAQKNINLISSTDNFWVSESMFWKWDYYSNFKKIALNIYSNKQVNTFMRDNFKDDLIYEIYQKSILPVQKIDLFRICCIYLHGGIWLDLKSEINIEKVLMIYNKNESNGILLWEPRKIEVIRTAGREQNRSSRNVIHNGFFALPKGSKFLKELLFNIRKDYLYFQDIVFSFPKQGIMNLTGPHQFTRTYFNLEKNKRPHLVSQKEIDWIFYSKYGEFISPFKRVKHYSTLKKLKTIDSSKKLYLE